MDKTIWLPWVSVAISIIYTILFGTAAVDKLRTLVVPDWFFAQFNKTFLKNQKQILKITYWGIAIGEVILAASFVVGLWVPAALGFALIGSLFMFAGLCFGLRISADFQGSANMFTYFAATLICLMIVGQ